MSIVCLSYITLYWYIRVIIVPQKSVTLFLMYDQLIEGKLKVEVPRSAAFKARFMVLTSTAKREYQDTGELHNTRGMTQRRNPRQTQYFILYSHCHATMMLLIRH